MNIALLSASAELIASIAVVISLIYLARQVRQANSHARGQTRERMVTQAQAEVYKGFVENPSIIQSLCKTEPLTEVEWIQLSGWLLASMRQREFEWFQRQDGNIDEDTWNAYRGVIAIHLGSPKTRKWWNTLGKLPFDKEFCKLVDELLDEYGETTWFEDFQQFIADQDIEAD